MKAKREENAKSPWYVAHSDDKRRARLNIITHMLGHTPYQALPRAKIELPKRQKPGNYRDRGYPFRMVEDLLSQPASKRQVRGAKKAKAPAAAA